MTALDRTVTITVGAGRARPQGQRRIVEADDPVLALATSLEGLSAAPESWWSGSTFSDDYREASRWESSDLAGVDLDFHDQDGRHAPLPSECASRISERVLALPGNLAHPTPRGLRIGFLLDERVTELSTWRAAARGAVAAVQGALVASGLAGGLVAGRRRAGLTLDTGASTDPARLWWAPTTVVDDVPRTAEVLVLRTTVYPVEGLVALAPRERPRPPKTPVRIRHDGASRFGIAVLRRTCQAVQEAAVGDRHETLKRRARVVAGYVAGGEIEEELAADCLVSAGLESGLPEKEVHALIRWAFKNGQTKPLASSKRRARR